MSRIPELTIFKVAFGVFWLLTTLVSGQTGNRKVDVAIVHDDSGSLQDTAANVRTNITSFVSELTDGMLDWRLTLVPYGGGGNFSSPEGTIKNDGNFYDNEADFVALLDQLSFDGRTERAFDSVHLAATGLNWRGDALKVIVLVTDENNDSGAVSEQVVTNTLVDGGFLFFGMTGGHSEFDRIAAAAQGQTYGVGSDFEGVFRQISEKVDEAFLEIGVEVTPEGAGNVTGAGSYAPRTTATLTASPNTSELPYFFLEWTEDGVSQGSDQPYTFLVENDRFLTAVFDLPTYQITATPNDALLGSVNGDVSAKHGREATVIAVPNQDGEFMSWESNGQILSTEASYTFTVTSAVSLVAVFKRVQTIDFDPITFSGLKNPLAATASSGLPVSFEVSPSNIASIEDGATLVAKRGGLVMVTASQEGNGEYGSVSETQTVRVPPVIQSFSAGGFEVANGSILLGNDLILNAVVLDIEGIDNAAFFVRSVGESSWTSLGTDLVSDDGLAAPQALTGLADGSYELRVLVETPNGHSAERIHNVVLAQRPVLTMNLGATIIEGGSVNGSITLERILPSDLVVTLSSSRPTQIDAGTPVVIPAGSTSVPFSISATQDNVIEGISSVRITASAPKALAVSSLIDLADDDWPMITLTLDRTTVSEAAGINAVVARIERDQATVNPLTVWLTNSDTNAAATPENVVVPAGETFVEFPIGVIDDSEADGAQTSIIVAEVRLADGTVIVEGDPVSLVVGDDEGPTLAFEFEKGFLLEGETGSAVLRRSGASVDLPLTVNLSSNLEGELAFPANVQIPAGAALANFSVIGVEDVVVDGGKLVLMTATAANHSPAQLSITVTDESLPDIVATEVNTVTTVNTEAEFNLSYRIENRGPASTNTGFVQRVFLSDDPVPGNDTLLNQYDFPSVLDAGVGFGRNETLRAPLKAGVYWLLVFADANNAVTEILESNNTSWFAQPIEVMPGYSAQVETSEDVVPANTPVPLVGSATAGDGSPAQYRMVNIHIRVNSTERVITAITDVAGEFSTSWQPLPGEGGDYEIGATHPGLDQAATQDRFTILTIQSEFPDSQITFDEGSTATITGDLTNPTGLELTGLTIEGVDLPAGLELSFTLPKNTLAPLETLQIGVAAAADAGFFGNHTAIVRLTTDQGVSLDVPLDLVVTPLVPRLVVTPGSLKCSVVRGSQKVASFQIENTGAAESGQIEILLPAIPWLSHASPSTLASIPPGGKAEVSLLLAPGETEPLTVHSGNMVVRPANSSDTNLNFSFRVVSNLEGDLEVSVVDEYFYFTADAPKVAGASVVVRDAVTAEEIARQQTGVDGLANFPNLTEGWYSLEVDSPDHTRHRRNVFIDAGETNHEEVFISRELVTYNWTVEETEIEDRYRVTVETTFETNVPAPVVTVDPPQLDVEDLTTLGQTKTVNLTITNHGFIAADHGEFSYGEHPFYEITPLIKNVGTIPAKSSLKVPVTITRIGVFAEDGTILPLAKSGASKKPLARPREKADKENVPCNVRFAFEWDYICGIIPVAKLTPIAVSGAEGHCPSGSGGGGGFGDGGGRGGGPSSTSITYSSSTPCDCTFFDRLCLKGSKKLDTKALGEAMAAALSAGLPPWLKVESVSVNVGVDGELCVCCVNGEYGLSGNGTASAEVKAEVLIGFGGSFATDFDAPGWFDVNANVSATAGVRTELSGSIKLDVDKECLEEGDVCITGEISLKTFAGIELEGSGSATYQIPNTNVRVGYAGSARGALGINGTASVTASGCVGDGFRFETCVSLVPEATLQLMLEPVNDTRNDVAPIVNLGGSLMLPDVSYGTCAEKKSNSKTPKEKSELPEGVVEVSASRFVKTDQTVIAETFPEILQNGGVCSQVKIQIDQEAVMTRSAFRATLELTNNQEDTSLTGVGFDLDIRDELGRPANEVFNVQVTSLAGLEAIDGSGVIDSVNTGSAQWTLIPRDTAAPESDTVYTIGGTIYYNQGGTDFSIPVQAVAITVRPDAALTLKYFHQRDVFSDDPHTDPTEPAIPYGLAVLVENQGAGPARDLSITSAQPKIVENEKGLFIDFKIIGTEVAGQNLSPSLTADFGTIDPGESKIATWLMTSTLHGLFIDYEATFEHLDGFGDPRLSLIKDVEIHEMIHMIRALGDKDDGFPDFLVNDIPDIDDLPDTVHRSDGAIEPVTVVQTASVTGEVSPANLMVTLNAGLGAGWSYLRVEDPSNGAFRLTRVVRSDGLELSVNENVWVTDRTFRGLGSRPTYENILHIADCDSTGVYTLHYTPLGEVDTSAPQSQLTALPTQSTVSIPVMWQGMDDTGVAGFDVFVRINNGSWQPWLENTTRTASIYDGMQGQSYEFYVLATDYAGNMESKNAIAETSTLVGLANQPPQIEVVPNVVVTEGTILELPIVATDPDGDDDAIMYDIESTVPGITVDTNTGILRWVTGETDGGSLVPVTVRAIDAGVPSASASVAFEISVPEVNSKPLVSVIEAQTVTVGEGFVIDVDATDSDSPFQALQYSLVDSPEGMSIDPNTGLISWIPSVVHANSNHSIRVEVNDDGFPSQAAEVLFAVQVFPATAGTDLVSVFAPIPTLLWSQGKAHSVSVHAVDPDGDPVTISADLSQLPTIGEWVGDSGTGTGVFTWNVDQTVPPGNYNIPLEAASGNSSATALLKIRVVPDDIYWNWAVENIDPKGDELNAFDLNGDSDSDGVINAFEMAMLMNPNFADAPIIECIREEPIGEKWVVLNLCFHRRKGSGAFVAMDPEYSDDGESWARWDWDWEAFFDPDGDDDSNPETEYVVFRIVSPRSGAEAIYRQLYRIRMSLRSE